MASLTEQEREQVIDLYKKGYRFTEITRETGVSFHMAKKLLVEEGVHEERRGHYVRKPQPPRKPYARRPTEFYQKEMEKKITMEDIFEVRRSTKIGDVIKIRTEKGDRPADLTKDSNLFVGGALRRATVVNTSNKRFCIVKLKSGVTESILWSDIVMAKKQNKASVG